MATEERAAGAGRRERTGPARQPCLRWCRRAEAARKRSERGSVQEVVRWGEAGRGSRDGRSRLPGPYGSATGTKNAEVIAPIAYPVGVLSVYSTENHGWSVVGM